MPISYMRLLLRQAYALNTASTMDSQQVDVASSSPAMTEACAPIWLRPTTTRLST